MSIEQNAAETKAARELLGQVARLILAEVESLPSARSKTIFWDQLHKAAAMRMPGTPACLLPPPPPETKSAKSSLPADVQDAIEMATFIIDNACSVPTEGVEYADSVSAKASEMLTTITKSRRVSEKQLMALENMKNGLERWLETSAPWE